jgi:hypothetical protein
MHRLTDVFSFGGGGLEDMYSRSGSNYEPGEAVVYNEVHLMYAGAMASAAVRVPCGSTLMLHDGVRHHLPTLVAQMVCRRESAWS